MKTRYVVLFLFLVCSMGLFTGCEQIAQVQTPIEFAQLRIANFNYTCSYEQIYDVYIYPTGQPVALPAVRGGLGYGEVTPWIDNIWTNRDGGMSYTVQVRVAGSTELVFEREITLLPGDRYTLWIFKFDDKPSALPSTEFISDKATFEPDQQKAYFRFLNTVREISPLRLKVGDPLSNTFVGETTGEAVLYRKYSDYTGYPASADATITLFVVDPENNVLGRIAGVALEGGTYKTITWGGNCPERYLRQQDATVPRPDSHHVRILDDAGEGVDETTPVPQTMRYFFVNALIPPSRADLKATHGYERLGVVINNDNRYNLDPLAPYSAAPTLGSTPQGIINVVPTSTVLTEAISVKGYGYNAATPAARGPLLFDFRAGPRQNITTDQLVAIVVSDTLRSQFVPGTKHPLDSSAGTFVFPIPDIPNPTKATFVIANMLAPKTPPAQNKISFWINGDSIEFIGVWSRKFSKTVDVPAGMTDLEAFTNANPNERIAFPTFNAEAGGIYLVLVVGKRLSIDPMEAPRIMVIRTNPRW